MSSEANSAPRAPVPRSRTRRHARRRFEVGRVLGTGISIWFGRLPVYIALAVVVFAPYGLLRWWAELEQPRLATSPLYLPGRQLLESLLSLVLSATVIFAVFQRLRGRRVGMATSIAYGLGRLPAVFGVGLLFGLVLVAIWLPTVALYLAGFEAGSWLVALPSFIVFAIAYSGLWVAIPVCVVERPGPAMSLQRSWTLTKGSKGAIFLVLLLLGILGGVIALIGLLLVGETDDLARDWTDLLISLGVAIVIPSLTAVVTAVGYHDLRRKVDGVDAQELASIFN